MTREEAMSLARTVSRECYRCWRVGENWEAVGIDRIVDEFIAEQTPAPDVQAQPRWPKCAKCDHDAHPLDCSERSCLCPYGTSVQEMLDAAVAREREACLEIVVDHAKHYLGDEGWLLACIEIADQIRARSGAKGV